MRQYVLVGLIVTLVLLAPVAVYLHFRSSDASWGFGVGFMMGAALVMLDRELAARRARSKPVGKPE